MLLIRTGGGSKTGFGHLTRMQRLASLLQAETEILFCIDRDKNAIKYMQEGKFPFCTPKELSAKTLDTLSGVIFDIREISGSEIALIGRLKKKNIPFIQITDIGLSPAPDASLTIDSSIKQINKYESDDNLYSGPEYALLHHRFRHFNKVKRKYRKKGKNIFICLGGGAEYKDIRTVVDLLTRYKYKMKIAPGFCLKKSARKTLKRIYPGIRFVGKPDSLARSFFEADIAIVSPGVSAFEAASCGTPSIYLSHNDEQHFIASSFEEQGVGLNMGMINNFNSTELLEKLSSMTNPQRQCFGEKGKRLVDGLGLCRIINLIKKSGLI